MFIHGLGSGFFWLTVHTYELTETKDHERDFYSSVLESGRQITMIAAPLLATMLIWLSASVFDLSSFTLLFAVAPFFYLLGLFCFKGIKEYYPEKIELADVTHFVLEKRNVLAQMYLAGSGSSHILSQTLIPLTIFYIVATELRVGLYATAAGVLSVIVSLILSRYRHEGNRILLFGLSAVAMALLLLFLGYTMTLEALIVFTLLGVIIQPIMNISDHVISLKTIENIGRTKKDFYATMILRDFSFWVWRMIAGVVVIFIANLFDSSDERLSAGLFVLAFVTILSFLGAKLLVTKMKLGEVR
jgi:MFS transporter, YQGE family, putative transporter